MQCLSRNTRNARPDTRLLCDWHVCLTIYIHHNESKLADANARVVAVQAQLARELQDAQG